MTDEEALMECQREIKRLRYAVRNLHTEINKVVDFARNSLDEKEDYLYCHDERSDDLYDCGYTDGEYDAYIRVLDLLGEKHDYQKQGGI